MTILHLLMVYAVFTLVIALACYAIGGSWRGALAWTLACQVIYGGMWIIIHVLVRLL